MIQEEGLRDWFGKSKSKDGKKGWVNVVTGDSCASDKPGEGIPKCVSSSKRASMSKKERVAAQAAKRREDPGQQSKSGASKPTNVKTDRKVRKEEMEVNEAKDKKGKGSGTKDACYHKVKSRYSVWPSAYASGALVKCRKVGAANWGNSTKEEVELQGTEELQQFMEKCWKGYEKKGMKTMFGKRYPNCVKKKVGESVSNWRDEIGYEGKDDLKKLSEDDMKGMSVKSGHKRPTKSGAGMTQKGVEAYRRRNPGSKLKTAVTGKVKKGSKDAKRRASYCSRSKGQMKMHNINCKKTPKKRICAARRRWKC